MSISKVHHFVERWGKGCFALLFIAFMMSFLIKGPGCGEDTGASSASTGTPVAMVGDYAITAQAIEMQVSNARDQQYQQTGSFDPIQEANAYAGAMKAAMHNAYIMALAKQQGVAVDDKNADQALPSLMSQQLSSYKEQMVASNLLKPNASEQEFADAFKKQTGQTLEQFRADFTKQFNEALTDPARRESMLAEMSRQNLLEKYAAGVSVNDPDLTRAYSTLTFKRILLGGKHGEEGQVQAGKILDEINRGMTFEQAIAKYSTEKSTKAKPATEATMDFPAQMLSFLPAYQPLGGLKVGEVSKPLDMPDGTSIFKLVKEVPQLPKDFAQNKERYRTTQRQQMAGAKLAKEAEALESTMPIQWKIPAYEAIYEFDKVSTDMTLSKEERDKRLAAIEQKGASALAASEGNTRVAALAEFAANSALYSAAKPEERKAIAARRITAIEHVLVGSESAALRIELSDLYMELGRSAEAIDQLKNAARSNNSMGPSGQSLFSQIQSKLSTLKATKKVGEGDAKEIQAELDRWRKMKLEQQAMEEQAKKREAELQKQAAEAAKRAAEEAKKNPPPATGSSPSASGTPPPATPLPTTGR